MKIWIVLIFTLFIPSKSFAKPFKFNEKPNESYRADKDLEEQTKNSLHCHLYAHLGEYSEYILSRVLPRLSLELEQLVRPQINENGELIQVAERLNYSDLFHSHIRIPIWEPSKNLKTLDSRFLNDENYHLQYHSYETADLFRQDWIEDLRELKNREINEWLDLQMAYLEVVKNSSSMAGNFRAISEAKPKPLESGKIQTFAKLWLERLASENKVIGPLDWTLQRLVEKIQFIDQGNPQYPTRITENRSVVSTNEAYTIIGPLDLHGFIQPVTAYFSRRSENPELDKLLARLEALGITYIVNPAGDYINKENFSHIQDWSLHEEWSQKFKSTAINSSTSPRSTFANALKDKIDMRRHLVFSWDKEFIYSLRYSLVNLKCDGIQKAN